MTWKRPESVFFPQVWWTFEAKDPDSGKTVKYRVQDLPEDRFEEVVHLMGTIFLRDDPMCKALDRINDPEAREFPQNMWRKYLEQKITVVCFKEGSDEICGFNLLAMFQKEEQRKFDGFITKKQQDFIRAVEFVRTKADAFNRHGVDRYLSAVGLLIVPKYRGLGLATEILKGRILLGKVLGFQLTAAVFTGIGSQRAAEKAGFVEDVSVLFEDLEKNEPFIAFPNISSPSAKFMSFRLIKSIPLKVNPGYYQ